MSSSSVANAPAASSPTDFIRTAVREDLAAGRFDRVQTRFPPEPNGFLHIGHAKAIALDFGLAADFDGICGLRFDDTNPARESAEYVTAMREDIHWLGFDWAENEFFASDYFQRLYELAEQLIAAGKAYVDSLNAEQIAEYRGAPTSPGRESPHRTRSIEENLDLFRRMRAGDFADGEHVLRAKIDMASPNVHLRDPVMYRIRHVNHHRVGDAWCIYPSYDWAHGQSDSLEGVTHSLCTLEFESHRPLYDWFLDALGIYHPRQIEFNSLRLTHTVTSKRVLGPLVERGVVRGWDDPRMPTLRGMRRRGYTASAIRAFIDSVGFTKSEALISIAQLEYHLRNELNRTAQRVMAVLHPLKLVITNWPAGQVEQIEAENNPEDPDAGGRQLPFSGELYIERDDFLEDPPKKYFRLSPGAEVRLKHAYYVTCTEVIKDAAGEISEVHVTYDPQSRGGGTADGRRVRGTLHWVSTAHAVAATVRLYEPLFSKQDMAAIPGDTPIEDYLNADSETVLAGCRVEPSLADVAPGTVLQFMRQGYFAADPDSRRGGPVFNRAVGLRDSWAKTQRAASS